MYCGQLPKLCSTRIVNPAPSLATMVPFARLRRRVSSSMPRRPTGAPRASVLSAGGVQSWSLNAGAAQASRPYWVFGSLSGISPGIPIGTVVLPLNPDVYFNYTINHPNQGPLVASLAFLGIVMWTTTQSALTAYRYGRVSTVMLYPLWWPMLAIPLGLALLAAVMLMALVDQVRALGRPRPDEVPPPETSA